MSEGNALEVLLADGPEGFLGARLRAYVREVNPTLREAEEAASRAGAGEAREDGAEEPTDTAASGAAASEANEEAGAAASGPPSEDAWRPAAIAYWQGLWSGTADEIPALWGVPPPPELQAFEEAVRGANLYSTFHELRLDVSLMGEPPPEKNLFEMLVLNDQLNYLGTGLPEAFAAAACFGQLGNGDTFHLELTRESEARPRAVLFWDHDEHQYSYTFARSLEDTVYLAALCYAANNELISTEAATSGYQKLRGKVAPSWHFSMAERDPEFVAYQHPSDAELPRYLAARAVWIISLLRSDGVTKLEDLKQRFLPKLNPVVPAELFPRRLEAARTKAATALYAMWRAYLFDEPELEQLLEAGRAHPGRLARDAARLIDELRGGRTRLGKIGDWPRLLERFRALDLDPRRELERAREAQERQRLEEAQRAEVVAAMQALAPSEVEAFCWEHVRARVARPQLWSLLLADASRAEARQGLQYLIDSGYSRDGSIYRAEEYAACRYVAERADGAVQALLLGEALWPAPAAASSGGEDEEDEGEESEESEANETSETNAAGGEVPTIRPSSHHAWQVLTRLPRAERLDARALPLLRAALEVPSLEERAGWQLTRVIEVVGLARDAGSVEALGRLLAMMPAEGELETALKFDDLIAAVALALQRIGEPAGAEPLLRFAAATSTRMRKARGGAAYAVATLAPARAGAEVIDGVLRMATEINGSDENTQALLSYGLLGRAQPAEAQPALLERLRAVTPKATSHVEVQLAQAIAARLLGGGGDEAAELMRRALVEPSWKEEHTVRRRRWAVAMFEVLPVVEAALVAPVLRMGNEELTAEAQPVLARHGHTEAPPRELSWFDARAASEDELVELLREDAGEVLGRYHAARALGMRMSPRARQELEAAVAAVAARAPGDQRELVERDDRLLTEAVKPLLTSPLTASTLALLNELLSHPNRWVKWPVLKQPPEHADLRPGMLCVAAEKWGWQESTALQWLERHGGAPPSEHPAE